MNAINFHNLTLRQHLFSFKPLFKNGQRFSSYWTCNFKFVWVFMSQLTSISNRLATECWQNFNNTPCLKTFLWTFLFSFDTRICTMIFQFPDKSLYSIAILMKKKKSILKWCVDAIYIFVLFIVNYVCVITNMLWFSYCNCVYHMFIPNQLKNE